jgi:hypothetical protein
MWYIVAQVRLRAQAVNGANEDKMRFRDRARDQF